MRVACGESWQGALLSLACCRGIRIGSETVLEWPTHFSVCLLYLSPQCSFAEPVFRCSGTVTPMTNTHNAGRNCLSPDSAERLLG